MTVYRTYLLKAASWLMIYLALMATAANASSIELPVIGTIDLPSFKYGKLKRDREANQVFQTSNVLSTHNYYISGRAEIPYAIIGVDKKYKLRPGLWQEIQLTTPLLRSWVSKMDNIYGYPPYGSTILDDTGEQIGLWFSSKQWTTVIIEENNEIAILAPEPPGFGGGN